MRYMSPEMEVMKLEALDVITLSGDDPADTGDGSGSNVPGAGAGGGTEWP